MTMKGSRLLSLVTVLATWCVVSAALQEMTVRQALTDCNSTIRHDFISQTRLEDVPTADYALSTRQSGGRERERSPPGGRPALVTEFRTTSRHFGSRSRSEGRLPVETRPREEFHSTDSDPTYMPTGPTGSPANLPTPRRRPPGWQEDLASSTSRWQPQPPVRWRDLLVQYHKPPVIPNDDTHTLETLCAKLLYVIGPEYELASDEYRDNRTGMFSHGGYVLLWEWNNMDGRRWLPTWQDSLGTAGPPLDTKVKGRPSPSEALWRRITRQMGLPVINAKGYLDNAPRTPTWGGAFAFFRGVFTFQYIIYQEDDPALEAFVRYHAEDFIGWFPQFLATESNIDQLGRHDGENDLRSRSEPDPDPLPQSSTNLDKRQSGSENTRHRERSPVNRHPIHPGPIRMVRNPAFEEIVNRTPPPRLNAPLPWQTFGQNPHERDRLSLPIRPIQIIRNPAILDNQPVLPPFPPPPLPRHWWDRSLLGYAPPETQLGHRHEHVVLTEMYWELLSAVGRGSQLESERYAYDRRGAVVVDRYAMLWHWTNEGPGGDASRWFTYRLDGGDFVQMSPFKTLVKREAAGGAQDLGEAGESLELLIAHRMGIIGPYQGRLGTRWGGYFAHARGQFSFGYRIVRYDEQKFVRWLERHPDWIQYSREFAVAADLLREEVVDAESDNGPSLSGEARPPSQGSIRSHPTEVVTVSSDTG